MVDRYRELEGLNSTRKLDVVLMATVSGFSSLQSPSPGEIRRFSELFAPVYEASSAEARRQAVAALSGNKHIPQNVCRFIGVQDIAIAGTFLARSPSISDDSLIEIINAMGHDHMRAIVLRNDLSQRVIEALISAHQPREEAAENVEQPASPSLANDTEALRQTLKAMATKAASDDMNDRLGLASFSELQAALLVRFARRNETLLFLETLSRSLGGDRSLAHQVLGDLSGNRLAVTLVALGMNTEDTVYILPRIFPTTALDSEAETRTRELVTALSMEHCIEQLLQWQKESASKNSPDMQDQPNGRLLKRRSA